MVRPQRLPQLLILGLISAGFGSSILAYRTLFPDSFDYLTSDEVVLGFLTCVGTFWLAVTLTESDKIKSDSVSLTNAFCIGTGINLMIQALFNYLDILTRSMFLIVVGGIFATALLALARRLVPAHSEQFQASTVMVGFDRPSAALVRFLPYPLAAVVSDPSEAPESRAGSPTVPYNEFENTFAALQPQQVVVTREGTGRIGPSALLAQRLRGASVNSASELYEELLGRVCCAGRKPVDLLLYEGLSGNPQAMAFQAIYTNLAGLVLLIALSPVIAVVVVMLLFSGPGPIIETDECCGFRNIPFLRTRFRTRRTDGSGSYHPTGRLISRLHLTDLPLLFNIVRGEMALFGPRPVRSQFAARLAEIVPFYSMRFSVRPGIVNWEDARVPRSQGQTCVLTEIEYDLYYAKHGSPVLDFEILMRLMFERRRGADPRVEFAPVPH